MKKSIRIAVAVLMAGVLAGCTFGGDEENGGSSGGSGGSTTVQNRFAGKTIEYEDTDREEYEDGRWYEDYEHTKMTFTKDTVTVYSEWRSASSYSEKVKEEKEEYQYTYVLESVNGNNLLCMTVKNPTITISHGSEGGDSYYKEYTLDEYIEEYYVGISSETKALLRKQMSTRYVCYEFTDNNTVKLYNTYYVGDMTKSGDRFYYDDHNSTSSGYTYVSFGQSRLRLEQSKQENGNWTDTEYWGIPQFNGKSFTADMYRVDEIRNEAGSWLGDHYTSVGKITGTYDINGTGSKVSGTISFTKFPDEMKNLFDASYQIQNYYPDDDDDDDPDYTEYTIK